ncbi:MAG: hypothetical protein Q9168_003665 [Polycauliona sp. 1 TL-2023]
MAKAEDSFLIIGAGVFGASTALHLIKKYPDASVQLVDREPFPCQVAASWDWNKVIRADYTDIVYMEKALEAKESWKWDPLFKDFYHESGIFWISSTDMAPTIAENFKSLQAHDDFRVAPLEEAKHLHGDIFKDADFTGVSQILINNGSGWAEAKKALKHVTEAAVKAGVKYAVADVSSLVFDEDGACIGVRSKQGDVFTATKTILSTGAGTARLIADSAPERKDIHVEDRLVAAAICTALVKLTPEAAARLSKAPVCVEDLLPGRGGNIPPNSDHELKFWRDISFRNTVQHHCGEAISMPPVEPEYGQWNVPKKLRNELDSVAKAIFGDTLQDFSLIKHRICWDSITPSKNFIISPHPRCKGLFVATGGSFHGWKFLPILGKYVLEMLENRLDPSLAKVWAWDRDKTEKVSYDGLWPQRELRDLM